MKLNALTIRTLKPGRYADGGGLYLLVKSETSKTWVFRFALRNKRRDMGLGAVADLSLAKARDLAREYRQCLSEGRDPIEYRAAKFAEAAKAKTFGDCLAEYLETKRAGWKTEKHASDIEASFDNHASWFLELPVKEVTLTHVVDVLKPIWGAKTETATRIQTRIEAVLGLAKVRNYRTGDNPGAWKDNLSYIFPARSAVQPVEHFEAMSRGDLPKFYASLKASQDVAAYALRFIILTVARTEQAVGASHDEIDLEGRNWVVPPERMKRPREHRVPLSTQAVDILLILQAKAQNEWLFPSVRYGKHLSNMACLMLMRRLKRTETVHGFRSTFKDWAAECTDYPGEVSEMALAHAVGDKVEAAYRRGDLLEKRRTLMQDWADFCESSSS